MKSLDIFALLKVRIMTTKNSKHLPKINKSHYSAILSKSWMDLDPVSSLFMMELKISLEVFVISCTDIRPDLILVLSRILENKWMCNL